MNTEYSDIIACLSKCKCHWVHSTPDSCGGLPVDRRGRSGCARRRRIPLLPLRCVAFPRLPRAFPAPALSRASPSRLPSHAAAKPVPAEAEEATGESQRDSESASRTATEGRMGETRKPRRRHQSARRGRWPNRSTATAARRLRPSPPLALPPLFGCSLDRRHARRTGRDNSSRRSPPLHPRRLLPPPLPALHPPLVCTCIVRWRARPNLWSPAANEHSKTNCWSGAPAVAPSPSPVARRALVVLPLPSRSLCVVTPRELPHRALGGHSTSGLSEARHQRRR